MVCARSMSGSVPSPEAMVTNSRSLGSTGAPTVGWIAGSGGVSDGQS
jgi:hypothetical protein